MKRGGWFLGAALVGVLFPVAAAAGSHAATTFASTHYGFSIVLPGGSSRYLVTPARTSWSGRTPEPGVDPSFDQINDLKTHSQYRVAAKSIPSSWTLRKWQSYTISTTDPPCTYKPGTLVTTSLGGSPALAYEVECSDGPAFQLAAIHGHRGYFVIYQADAVELPALTGELRSFRFQTG